MIEHDGSCLSQVRHVRAGKSAAWAFALAALLFALPANGENNSYVLCFPFVSWFRTVSPPVTPVPPTIDGIVAGDPGWTGAFVYNSPTGGPGGPDVVLRGILDSGATSNLYLAIDANNLSIPATGDSATLVVITFDPDPIGDPTHTKMQRIFVFPMNLGATAGYQGKVLGIRYWGSGTDSTGTIWQGSPSTTWLGSTATATPNFQVSYTQDATGALPFHWHLEMKLPRTGDPATGLNDLATSFGFYVDVFRAVNGNWQQSSWPGNAPETGCPMNPDIGNCKPTSQGQTPAPSAWGLPTGNTSCGGVVVPFDSLGRNIFTNQSPTGKIATNAPNTFSAYVRNTSIDASSGTVVAVPAQVRALFSIANYGLPSPYIPWDSVPTDPGATNPNPTPTKTIDATACTGNLNNNNPACIVQIGPWNLTPTQVTDYTNANKANQCIRVFLEPAPGTNTLVLNNITYANMNFGTASKFHRTAEISGKAYPSRPKRVDGIADNEQIFELQVLSLQEVSDPRKPQSQPGMISKLYGAALPRVSNQGKRVVSSALWEVKGCRRTGYYMTIEGVTRELCEPVGEFGFVIQHIGTFAVSNWRHQFSGNGLAPIQGKNDIYEIHVPQEDVAQVGTGAEPREIHLAAFLDAGAGLPHGSFGTIFNPGFSFNAGLEYMLTSYVSAEGIFGYHHFPSSIGNLHIYQFSGNAKLYLVSPQRVRSFTVRPFTNGGVGLYELSPGGAHFGGNVGGGALFELTSRYGIQGSYNFHAVNTTGGVTKFSTFQGGIRWVF
jgi:hypothetical protein